MKEVYKQIIALNRPIKQIELLKMMGNPNSSATSVLTSFERAGLLFFEDEGGKLSPFNPED